jgi:hypothetical protein
MQAAGAAVALDRPALGRDWQTGASEIPDAPRPILFQTGNDPRKAGTGEVALPHAAPTGEIAGLPAFDPADWSASMDGGFDARVEPTTHAAYVPLKDCPTDETRARECRMHWGPMVMESLLFNAFEDGGNVYTGYWYRNETLTGKWWDRYVASVQEQSGAGRLRRPSHDGRDQQQHLDSE